MNELRKKLVSLVTDYCLQHGAKPGDFEIRLGTTRLGRISGLLIWDRYDSMDIGERVHELWGYLFSVLSPDELRNVTRFYTRGASEVDEDELAVQTSAPLPWEY